MVHVATHDALNKSVLSSKDVCEDPRGYLEEEL
jgi:hypothetical protein